MSQEYLHGLRVALETERRRVEELEAEVCRLNRELAVHRVSDGYLRAYQLELPAFGLGCRQLRHATEAEEVELKTVITKRVERCFLLEGSA